MNDAVAARLAEIGLVIPTPQGKLGDYVPGVVAGDLLFLSGQTPQVDGAPTVRGRVGVDVEIPDAAAAAGVAALNALALAARLLGSLDRVAGVVRVTGYVASPPEFERHPEVLDGASRVFVQAFGEAGRHARSAVGVSSLPQGAPVEIDVVLRLVPESAVPPIGE